MSRFLRGRQRPDSRPSVCRALDANRAGSCSTSNLSLVIDGVTCERGQVASDRAVIPRWVVPDGRAISDAHRIAYWTAVDHEAGGRQRPGGVAAAIDWVTGGQPAPITKRVEVTQDVAWAEWMLAGSVETGVPMVWGSVEPRGPVIRDPAWAAGAGAALGWLLGATVQPPVAIPRRLPDGGIPTVDQLYRELVAARPHAAWTPEERMEARQRAAEAAQAYRDLAFFAGPA